MKLIIGLGNPGEEYSSTRHNIGFMVVEKLAKELGTRTPTWELDSKRKAEIAHIGDVYLVKPQTFMNNSGEAVHLVMQYYKVSPQDLWVVHDDLDLALGKIRIRAQGGSGGHHGVDSIMKAVNSDSFIRFRLGIGREKELTGKEPNKNLHHRSVIEFVLSRFRQNEAGAFKHLIKHGAQAVQIALIDGLDRAMNRFN